MDLLCASISGIVYGEGVYWDWMLDVGMSGRATGCLVGEDGARRGGYYDNQSTCQTPDIGTCHRPDDEENSTPITAMDPCRSIYR